MKKLKEQLTELLYKVATASVQDRTIIKNKQTFEEYFTEEIEDFLKDIILFEKC